MKKMVARMILRWYLPRFLGDAHPFNRLLGHAIKMQLGWTSDEAFRTQLAGFYQQLDPQKIKHDIDFEDKVSQLDRPGGYKVSILNFRDYQHSSRYLRRFDMWARRFGLLARLGIRADVLILRSGEQVPPHGHYHVVSGFYVLEGKVAIRHYDRIREQNGKLLVRKVLDTELDPGGYTTNSETYHNIHWVQGLADRTYLFRVTATGTPTTAFGGVDRADSRVYVDPTGEPDAFEIITASYISEEAAKQLYIHSPILGETR
jgi:hypothetical protein